MVRRMGSKKENKIRPIIVSFTTFGKKLAVLKHKQNLKNHGMYIKQDYPPQVLEARKKLQEQLEKEKEKGNNAYIRHNKLIVHPHKTTQHQFNTNMEQNKQKKRELEITPPNPKHNIQSNPTQNTEPSTSKGHVAKKNKVTGHQSQLSNFFHKQNNQNNNSDTVQSNSDNE
ncbi:unnamed protein product [Colias eurytheme]|nr:unnamed protein product [Colias eurytheme]